MSAGAPGTSGRGSSFQAPPPAPSSGGSSSPCGPEATLGSPHSPPLHMHPWQGQASRPTSPHLSLRSPQGPPSPFHLPAAPVRSPVLPGLLSSTPRQVGSGLPRGVSCPRSPNPVGLASSSWVSVLREGPHLPGLPCAQIWVRLLSPGSPPSKCPPAVRSPPALPPSTTLPHPRPRPAPTSASALHTTPVLLAQAWPFPAYSAPFCLLLLPLRLRGSCCPHHQVRGALGPSAAWSRQLLRFGLMVPAKDPGMGMETPGQGGPEGC